MDLVSDLESKICPTGGCISYIWWAFNQLFLSVFSERTFSKLPAAAIPPAYGWAVWAGSSGFPFSYCYHEYRKPKVKPINALIYGPSLRGRGSTVSPLAVC